MKSRLAIHLKDGQCIEGQLARTFGNNSADIEVRVDETQQTHTFSLEEVCYIYFSALPAWAHSADLASLETVETITGETFRVMIFPSSKFERGFVGILQDTSAPFPTMFFAFSGVRCRTQERLIGQIIQEQTPVSDKIIKDALKTQESLRKKRMGEHLAAAANIPREVIETTIQKDFRTQLIPRNVRVGDILMEAGLVTREQIQMALDSQKAGRKVRVGELLISLGFVTEEQLLLALATKFELDFVDLEQHYPSEEAMGALSEGLVTRLRVFPLEISGRKLRVATSNPTDSTIGDSLRFNTNYFVELVVATSEQIAAAIDRHYNFSKNSVDSLLEEMGDEGQSVAVEDELDSPVFIEPDSKVISLINKILIDAYKKGASDIHFEPGSGKRPISVRYRIDGECVVVHTIASTFKNSIISRIKIISGLDISEHRKPQSGKITIRYEQRKLEFRVEITPTVGGNEDAVLRLLAASKPLPIEEMGLMPYNLSRFKDILNKPYGLILCVGPTGSGKTTTLHSALGYINRPNRKIWTVEDPVEITQSGLRQVQVNYKIGFTFAQALRSFLRADPDVIMIGEMRDAETARIAIESSLTGHLVFSTLHTNSAPETVVRLIDMGMDSFNFADALLLIVAQRLARKLCDSCKKPIKPGREIYDELMEIFVREAGHVSEHLPSYDNAEFMAGTGCEKCSGTGYKGRIALHELMMGTPAVKRAIKTGAGADELKILAQQEGMWTLKMDGIMKVLKGYTDMDQVFKVCL
ncbi:MAG: ATPase, T2SS/T4P/T4SS family [Desulfuromonadaceae bacterium]